MKNEWRLVIVACVLFAELAGQSVTAQDDVVDIKSQDLRVGENERMRYFLVGPREAADQPESGYGLIVLMPGGDGSEDFHAFVKRIYKHAIPQRFILAQLVAIKWTPEQKIVWPTDNNPVKDMEFSTEEFVDAVINDVGSKHEIDPNLVLTLSWSSSGPAAYSVSLTSKQVTGAFIAMSVYKPETLPPLEASNGQAYVLYHSPDDRVCPYRMAEEAAKDLGKHGANVKLMTYQGGHGWRAGLYENIKQGVQWLEKNHLTREQRG